MNTTSAQQDPSIGTDANYVDAYSPPSPQPGGVSTVAGLDNTATPAASSDTVPAAPVLSTASSQSETLEDQNIFFLLGVRDGTDQQKESFLDELQQVIWEDFLEYDVKLLITSDEMAELQVLLDSQSDKDLEKQEKVIVYLEKLIPDLEEIMLEKALELKEEMVRERVSGLRQYFADKPEKLQRVDEAERLINEGKWYSSAHLMNSLFSS